MRAGKIFISSIRMAQQGRLPIWLVFTLLPVWGFFSGKTPWGHNPEFHIMRTMAVGDAWANGLIIPRWAPSLGGGLGYPIFNYYGWSVYGFSAACRMAGLGAPAATNAICLISALLLGSGAWLLGRELAGTRGAWACWALYTYAPYQMLNLYVRGTPPEYAAGALAPWLLWGIIRVARGSGRSGGDAHVPWAMLGAGFALSLMIFTHNIGAWEFGPLTAVFGAAFALSQSGSARHAAVLRVLGTLFFAGAMAAHFWLPLAAGLRDVQLGRVFSDETQYESQLILLRQLLDPKWKFGYSPSAPDAQMSFQAGIVQIIVLAGGLAAVLDRRRWRHGAWMPAGLCLGGAVILLFLTTIHSKLLWRLSPPLRLVQFPWRLLLPAELLIAAGGAYLAGFYLPRLRAPGMLRRRPEVLLAGLAVLCSLPFCRPRAWLDFPEPALRRIMRNSYVTTTIKDEYRPAKAVESAAAEAVAASGMAWVNGAPAPEAKLPVPESRMRFSLRVSPQAPENVVLPVFYFPGWHVMIGGQPVPLKADEKSGLLAFRVPPGPCEIRAAWRPTPLQRLSAAISAAALALFLAMLHWMTTGRIGLAQTGSQCACRKNNKGRP